MDGVLYHICSVGTKEYMDEEKGGDEVVRLMEVPIFSLGAKLGGKFVGRLQVIQ